MIAEIRTRRYPLWLIQAIRISLFAVLMALSAKIRIEIPPAAPITGQTLMVFITGMALGPIEGAISLALYVCAIAAGAPIDARGLGPLVFAGPTAGYLWGFIAGAFISGLAWRAPERYRYPLSILAGLGAAILILLFGATGWALNKQIGWGAALLVTVYPFILIEPGKVLLAASLVRLGRESWVRWIVPRMTPNDPQA